MPEKRRAVRFRSICRSTGNVEIMLMCQKHAPEWRYAGQAWTPIPSPEIAIFISATSSLN